MASPRVLRPILLGLLAFPLLVGCATLNSYRDSAERLQSRYTVIENYGTEPIEPAVVDELLLDVAALLGVTLEEGKPKARIVVTTPGRIQTLYRAGAGAHGAANGSYAVALYFPGASLVMVPYADREILGHELAHYVTDHYLKSARRSDWEKIAHRVEDKIGTYRRPAAEPVTVAAAGGPATP